MNFLAGHLGNGITIEAPQDSILNENFSPAVFKNIQNQRGNMTDYNSRVEIKEQALTLIISIQNNIDAYDDELEETFIEMMNMMTRLKTKIDRYIECVNVRTK